MFKFLKDKLKKSLSLFGKKVEEESEEVKEEEIKESVTEESTVSEEKKEEVKGPLPETKEAPVESTIPEEKEEESELITKEPIVTEDKKASKEPEEEYVPPSTEENILHEELEKDKETELLKGSAKKGLFGAIKEKITTKKINDKRFEDLFWELEIAMLESNVAVEVVEKIKSDLKDALVDKPIPRSSITKTIITSLKTSVESLFEVPQIDLLHRVKEKKPFVICFVGVNGSGKTTTIAKVAKLLLDNKHSCVLAAADTFRAAAIDQLQEHADMLNIKMIKHDYGSDPAAVAFDAVRYAEARKKDVVLIDTAGRMHSNTNLIDEMKKIVKVAKPDIKIFIGESITGNDCIEQAKKFNEAIDIDAIILAKADIDDKGGAAISLSYVTGKPILYLGTGQTYNDLEPFETTKIISSLGL